jgi:hypothetical protein
MQESNLLSLTRIGFRNQRITVLPILLGAPGQNRTVIKGSASPYSIR